MNLEPLPCQECGDPDGIDPWNHECRNHHTWVECPLCGVLAEFQPFYHDESDESVGVYGGWWECPACGSDPATGDEVPEPLAYAGDPFGLAEIEVPQ